MAHQQTLQSFAALKKQLQNGTVEFGTVVQCQTFELNTVAAERFHVRIIHKINTVQIDDSQIWNGTFQFVDIDHLVDLLLLFHCFLVGSNQMQNFKSIDEVVDSKGCRPISDLPLFHCLKARWCLGNTYFRIKPSIKMTSDRQMQSVNSLVGNE